MKTLFEPSRNNKPVDSRMTDAISPSRMCALVRHWYEDVLSGTIRDPARPGRGAWDEGDFHLAHLFTNDYENHVLPAPAGGWKRGIAGAVQIIQSYRLSCPDLTIEIQDQMVSGDKVITRYTAEGTHTAGPFLNIPATSKHYKVTGISIHRIANGKLAECWCQWDVWSLLSQLGALPGPTALD